MGSTETGTSLGLEVLEERGRDATMTVSCLPQRPGRGSEATIWDATSSVVGSLLLSGDRPLAEASVDRSLSK